MIYRVEMPLGGSTLSIESGKVAKQADGAVLVRCGETIVLATAVASREPDYTRDFFPLFVDYREKFYAAGRIPGGFFKREGRPSEREILSAREIDRPIRPFFPKGYSHEVQVLISVLSFDQENDPGALGIIGAATALLISDIPFEMAIAGVRVGRVDGRFAINPTLSQLKQSDLQLTVAGHDRSIVMVEGEAREIPEEGLLQAMEFAHQEIRRVVELQREFATRCGRSKRPFVPLAVSPDLEARIRETAPSRVLKALTLPVKEERMEALRQIRKDYKRELEAEFPESGNSINLLLEDIERSEMRRLILEEGMRVDGRGPDGIRPVSCEVGILPRTHGSGLFTRGQTQALVVTTLGTSDDEQIIDNIEGDSRKTYMLHYNFPPFCVGEVAPIRGPGRRETGHGALAERALRPVLPEQTAFPYTIRLVSDILECNGSSSMATVCGGSLALMDAGVPVRDPVAGIAMGLIADDGKVTILSDILGIEDHLGDMDFKVAGTRQGITAFQMDIKTDALTFDILRRALGQARAGREHILDVMAKTISHPRPNLSPYAPRIITITINTDKIREVIGPGGKVIRKIIEETGAEINVEDTGVITIASVDQSAGERALQRIKEIVAEPEIGVLYWGVVKNITNFGCFVEFMPGREGLVHISELAEHRVRRVEDVVKLGDRIRVKLIGIDNQNRVKLSHKAALKEEDHPHPSTGGEGHDHRRSPRDQER